ncbi:MAG: ABC transporter ATP-binding protein [Rhizobiaceae bacterium]
MNDTQPAGEANPPDQDRQDRSNPAIDLITVCINRKIYVSGNGQTTIAVQDCRFSLVPNAFTVLIGPSGCGKTTILRILTGLDDDYDGFVEWPESPRIGYMFQEPRLLPWRSVRENITLTADPGFTENDLGELLNELGLASDIALFPGELSVGMARRVALARAFACKPNVLVLDEPFVSLDEAAAERLRNLLIRVWSGCPTTAIMVTHNLREALQLADELIIMKPGPTSVCQRIRIAERRQDRDDAMIETMRNDLRNRFSDLG